MHAGALQPTPMTGGSHPIYQRPQAACHLLAHAVILASAPAALLHRAQICKGIDPTIQRTGITLALAGFSLLVCRGKRPGRLSAWLSRCIDCDWFSHKFVTPWRGWSKVVPRWTLGHSYYL